MISIFCKILFCFAITHFHGVQSLAVARNMSVQEMEGEDSHLQNLQNRKKTCAHNHMHTHTHTHKDPPTPPPPHTHTHSHLQNRKEQVETHTQIHTYMYTRKHTCIQAIHKHTLFRVSHPINYLKSHASQ